jgi:hypothetical protein
MKTEENQFHAVKFYLPSTVCNTKPTTIHNSGSVSIEMEGYEDGRFKQCAVIQFGTAAKIPPIDIHRHMQAVCGDKCVYVNMVRLWVWQFKQEEVEEASCNKVSSGRPVTATNKSHQEHIEEMIR